MVEALRKNLPHAFLDCHLMVSDPTFWIQPLATACADLFTFHLEAVGSDISKAIEWYTKAAEKGVVIAAKCLRKLTQPAA